MCRVISFLFPWFVFIVGSCHSPDSKQAQTDNARNSESLYQERQEPSSSIRQDENTLLLRFPVPPGYVRVNVPAGSFTAYVRNLPLKPTGSLVHLYDGRIKRPGNVYEAVIDMDIGSKDLQQCADAIIRLRAEYLYACGATGAIHFCFTSGDTAFYSEWAEGERPTMQGNKVLWRKSAPADYSYLSFRSYLEVVFTYASTLSLEKELVPVADRSTIMPGDVFIEGGSPGHAVMVADVAVQRQTGKKCFLLVQSYMPAQDLHVLRNLKNPVISPWYELPEGELLETPEWTFQMKHLRRFR
jgi:hypothetical protein